MEYSDPFRPLYEGYAAAVWMAGAAACALTASWSGLPRGPFLYMAGASLGMAALRGTAWGIRLWHRRGLGGRKVQFIGPSGLRRKMAMHKGDVWLGRGFDWTPKHTQLAFEILRRDARQFRHDAKRPGAQWLHGLEPTDRDIYVPLNYFEGHTLIVGTTGAGKTRLLDIMVTQAVLRGEPVIILDPKGDKELCANARRACVMAKRPDAFVYFHPAYPENSARIDPLKNWNRSSELANRIAALIPSETGNDPFKAFGQMVLDHVVQGLTAVDQRPNLIKLRRYVEGGPEKLLVRALTYHFDRHVRDWTTAIRPYTSRYRPSNPSEEAELYIRFYREKVEDDAHSVALDGLISQYEHERAHFQKMVASLMPILNMLTSGTLGPLLSPNEDDPEDTRPAYDVKTLINGRKVAYIGLDALSDGAVGAAIGAILLADLTAAAGDRYNYGVENHRVNVFIDEASEIANDPFIQLLNKGRGAGITVTLATQTFSDFAARMGSEDKARQVLGNTNNLIALRTLDAKTQKYLAEGLPKTTVKKMSYGQGENALGNQPALFTGTYGERLQDEESELVSPEIFGLLPNLQYIARLTGGRVVKGRLPILVGKDR